MAVALLGKPSPCCPLLTSRPHSSGRSFANRRRRSVYVSRSTCTGSARLSKSEELSVSTIGAGGAGDRAMFASVEASSKVGSGFHFFRNFLNGIDDSTQQSKRRVLRGGSPVCVSSHRVPNRGFGHESDVDTYANSTMDGYAPPHALRDRSGGPVEGQYDGDDRETGSSSFSSLVDSVNQKPGVAGIQEGISSPGTNPSDGYRSGDVYASESSPVEEFNPVQSPRPAPNTTFHPSPATNRRVPRTAGAFGAPSSTNRPMEGNFNRSQAPPSRAYSTSSGLVEGSYRPPQETRPIESAGSISNPSYFQQQPGNIYRSPQAGGASPSHVHLQQQQPEYSANNNRPGQDSRFNDSYRPGADSVSRDSATGVPPSRQSGSPQGGIYNNTQGNTRPVNFNTAQEASNVTSLNSYGTGTNDLPGSTSKSPADGEPSAAAAAIDKYLGPSTLKLEKRDSNSLPPPPPRRRYPNTTEKKSGKDLVAESAACAVIEKYLGPWPGFPPRDPKIDEYLDSLPENAACAAIDKYFGPYKPLFVFKKNEGENGNGPAASRPPRNRNMGRPRPHSRANPPQGSSTSRPWTPPSQGSSDNQSRNPPAQGASESRTWTPPQGASDRRPTGPGSEDIKPQ